MSSYRLGPPQPPQPPLPNPGYPTFHPDKHEKYLRRQEERFANLLIFSSLYMTSTFSPFARSPDSIAPPLSQLEHTSHKLSGLGSLEV